MDIYEFDRQYRAGVPADGASAFLLAGMDEAGRGPLAGPVVAAAVVLPPGERIEGLNDSKQVSATKRGRLFNELLCRAWHIGVGVVDAREIDEINILQATKKAMRLAVADLSVAPAFIITDAMRIHDLGIPHEAVIKGDAKSASVAAASIVAKVVRDSLMDHYHALYPGYGFDRHKGYGTEAHLDSLRRHGPCPIHRVSFRGVLPEPEGLRLPL